MPQSGFSEYVLLFFMLILLLALILIWTYSPEGVPSSPGVSLNRKVLNPATDVGKGNLTYLVSRKR